MWSFLYVKGTDYYHAGPFNSMCQSDLILYAFSITYLQKYAWVSLLLAWMCMTPFINCLCLVVEEVLQTQLKVEITSAII